MALKSNPRTNRPMPPLWPHVWTLPLELMLGNLYLFVYSSSYILIHLFIYLFIYRLIMYIFLNIPKQKKKATLQDLTPTKPPQPKPQQKPPRAGGPPEFVRKQGQALNKATYWEQNMMFLIQKEVRKEKWQFRWFLGGLGGNKTLKLTNIMARGQNLVCKTLEQKETCSQNLLSPTGPAAGQLTRPFNRK